MLEWLSGLDGMKTYIGAGIVAVSAFIGLAYPERDREAAWVAAFGASVAAIGLRHAIQKVLNLE